MLRTICAAILAPSILLLPSAFGQAPRAPSIFDLIQAGDLKALQDRLQQSPTAARETSSSGASPLMYAAYFERSDMVEALRRSVTDLSFFEACIVGDMPALRAALARGQDVDQRSADGFTPLGLAVFFRRPEAARLLIEAGADINARAANAQQVGPIHAAVGRSDAATLQLLLLRGADPNLPQMKLVRPLHDAAASGNLATVAMLLVFGADSDARTEDGQTPADLARGRGHVEIARRLEQWGGRLKAPPADEKAGATKQGR